MTRTLAVNTLAAIFALIAIPIVTAQETTIEGESSGAAAILFIAVFAIVLLFIVTILFLASRYRRCPPDKVLVVYGRTGAERSSKPVHGGGVLVLSLIHI